MVIIIRMTTQFMEIFAWQNIPPFCGCSLYSEFPLVSTLSVICDLLLCLYVRSLHVHLYMLNNVPVRLICVCNDQFIPILVRSLIILLRSTDGMTSTGPFALHETLYVCCRCLVFGRCTVLISVIRLTIITAVIDLYVISGP
jgi:hypothetical protein